MAHAFGVGAVAMRVEQDVPEIHGAAFVHIADPVAVLHGLELHGIHVPGAHTVGMVAERNGNIDGLVKIDFVIFPLMKNGSNHDQAGSKKCSAVSRILPKTNIAGFRVTKLTINRHISFIFYFFDHYCEKIIHKVFNKKKFKNFDLNKNYHNLVP